MTCVLYISGNKLSLYSSTLNLNLKGKRLLIFVLGQKKIIISNTYTLKV